MRLRGRAGLYLDGGYPEEADVEHAVGHEPHQVEGHKVEAQTHDTRGEGWGDKAGCGVRLGAAGAWRVQSSQHLGRRAWLSKESTVLSPFPRPPHAI